ncbi:calcium-binding protein [Falsirhodobacter sp. 20TX0035]|uniref:calcium-binding protein n=1 Tax=Falsirhodobacter sp. 20TX0035 TaxID=3022019 RepID=UPI00232BF79C|nr:hypothetical protein [Falsirhodobacter sp. 20TX0035]MDB6452705.1 hypothetical protein [Falsirhodobacter sp. 20TX0035]
MKGPQLRQVFEGNALAHWSSLTSLSVVTVGADTFLFAASEASAGMQSFRISDTGSVSHAASTSLGGTYSWPDDLLPVTLNGDLRLLLPSDDSGATRMADVLASGGAQMSGLTGLASATTMTSVEVGGQTFLAAADSAGAHLRLYALNTNWTVKATDVKADSDKTMLDGVNDLVSVTVGGKSFVLSSSPKEGGITAHEVTAAGKLILTDELRPKDGLWVSGIASLHKVEVAGEQYVIAASNLSSSISVVRVNDLGVMFVQDQLNDDLTTRFHGVEDLAIFTKNDRTFIVAAGNDGGVSLLELLPGGELYHHLSTEAEGWTPGAVASVEAVVRGDDVQIFLGRADMPGLVHLTLDMGNLGNRIQTTSGHSTLNGTNGGDLLIGGGARDVLNGGKGDDVLMGRGGGNHLTGGAGADVFVLAGNAGKDYIADFIRGEDRIDLSDWGMIYDPSVLTIVSSGTSATLSWNGHTVIVQSGDDQSLKADTWTADDFLF